MPDRPAANSASARLDYHVLRYRYDSKTSVEREGQRIDVPGLRPGEHVAVDADAAGDEPLRYARTVHVTIPLPAPVKNVTAPTRLRPYSLQEERLLPKGDLAFSGVIVRLDNTHLVLRTRVAGEQTIMLRQDTRYLENGALSGTGGAQAVDAGFCARR